MPLNALLIASTTSGIWARDIELLFAPFPRLGIRVDVYVVLNVVSVIVGDLGYDVTCFVGSDDIELGEFSAEQWQCLGFVMRPYP